jgi:hypothetical protein
VNCLSSLGAQLTGQLLAVQVTTWMQCGGKRGPAGASMQDSSVCCPGEAPCTYVSDWYWQCLASGQGGGGSRPSSNSGCTKVSAAVRHQPGPGAWGLGPELARSAGPRQTVLLVWDCEKQLQCGLQLCLHTSTMAC